MLEGTSVWEFLWSKRDEILKRSESNTDINYNILIFNCKVQAVIIYSNIVKSFGVRGL